MLKSRRIGLALLLVSLLGMVGIGSWLIESARRSRFNNPMLEAIRKGEVATVRGLLERGADPNARFQEAPVSSSFVEFLKELLSSHQRRNSPDAPTALLLAAQYNRDGEITRLLLEHGANPERTGTFGYDWMDGTSLGTPLIAAACNRHPQVVRVLLEHGADPNAVSKTRQTALMFAAVKGEIQMTRMLMDQGANPNLCDIYGHCPLVDASDWGQRYENNHPVYDEIIRKTLSPEEAHLQVVRRLLEAKSDPIRRFEAMAGALPLAAYGKHPDLVRYLLQQGVDPQKADKKGWTPLHYAAADYSDWDGNISKERKIETLRLLLEAGADINARTQKGETPLMLAAANWNPDQVRFLISRGSEVNATLKNGNRTALGIASESGNEAVCKVLRQAGAH